jgi:transcriptional regulator with XRE-family HTH domain
MRLSAERLAYEAAIRGWDQRRLARESGVSETTVSRVMRGLPMRGLTALQLVQALRRHAPVPELVALVPRLDQERRAA